MALESETNGVKGCQPNEKRGIILSKANYSKNVGEKKIFLKSNTKVRSRGTERAKRVTYRGAREKKFLRVNF
jgi:hypothetical protein